jgi:hypothetical protein
VWEAEEKVKKEQAHVDELRKKFSEEQKIEDMRKIQIDAGLLPYVLRILWHSAPSYMFFAPHISHASVSSLSRQTDRIKIRSF